MLKYSRLDSTDPSDSSVSAFQYFVLDGATIVGLLEQPVGKKGSAFTNSFFQSTDDIDLFRIRYDELLNRLGIECVENKIQRGRLRWFGHVERKEENNWVKKCTRMNVIGVVDRGAPRTDDINLFRIQDAYKVDSFSRQELQLIFIKWRKLGFLIQY